MTNVLAVLQRTKIGALLFSCGIVLSVVACGLIAAHTRSFSLKRDTAVMIGTTLPELRSSVALLRANTEAEQLFAQNARIAREEQASVYILPEGPAASRVVDALTTIATALGKEMKSDGSMSSLTFDTTVMDHGSYKTVGAHLTIRGDRHFLARFLTILSFGGDMMIRDVLTEDDIDRFLRLVEADSPLSLKDAEDFLYTDLLQYLAHPEHVEQALWKDISPEAQSDLKTFLLTSGLPSAKMAFGSLVSAMNTKRVWPLPLLSIDALSHDADRWLIDVTLYRR